MARPLHQANKKAFLFSDIHASSQALGLLFDTIKLNNADLILFAGDIVNMGEPLSYAQEFIDVIKKTELPFLWIPGNNDFGRSYELVKAQFPTLEGRIVELVDHKFTGVGGSPESWAGHYAGDKAVNSESVAGSIFITHAPPPVAVNLEKFDKNYDKSQHNIKKLKDSPLVHICGHVHSRWGVGYLGETKIIKLAPFFFGHYAIMDLETLIVEFGKANGNSSRI